MTQRACFTIKVREDALAEYVGRHAAVWPEMCAALREAGWRNYSLFSTGSGTIVGYCEVDDFDAALAAMQEMPVNARWQAEMAPLLEVAAAPDETLERLEEIFHLD